MVFVVLICVWYSLFFIELGKSTTTSEKRKIKKFYRLYQKVRFERVVYVYVYVYLFYGQTMNLSAKSFEVTTNTTTTSNYFDDIAWYHYINILA